MAPLAVTATFVRIANCQPSSDIFIQIYSILAVTVGFRHNVSDCRDVIAGIANPIFATPPSSTSFGRLGKLQQLSLPVLARFFLTEKRLYRNGSAASWRILQALQALQVEICHNTRKGSMAQLTLILLRFASHVLIVRADSWIKCCQNWTRIPYSAW